MGTDARAYADKTADHYRRYNGRVTAYGVGRMVIESQAPQAQQARGIDRRERTLDRQEERRKQDNRERREKEQARRKAQERKKALDKTLDRLAGVERTRLQKSRGDVLLGIFLIV